MHGHAPLARRALAQSQYQSLDLKGRLDGSNPHQLVAVLYEELLRALDVVATVTLKGQRVAAHPQVERARSILIALESSLDFRAGGSLSQALAGVYRSMRRELGEAVRTSDHQKLVALADGAREIARAWSAIRS